MFDFLPTNPILWYLSVCALIVAAGWLTGRAVAILWTVTIWTIILAGLALLLLFALAVIILFTLIVGLVFLYNTCAARVRAKPINMEPINRKVYGLGDWIDETANSLSRTRRHLPKK